MHRLAPSFLLLLLAAVPVAAQVPTVPDKVFAHREIPIDPKKLDTLSETYNSGRWSELQQLGRTLLEPVRRMMPNGAFNLQRDYVMLVWTGEDAAEKPALLSTLVHDGALRRYTTRLPGLHRSGKAKYYEVYLSAEPLASFGSYYLSTEVENPLLAQLPAFAAAVSGPLFSLLGQVRRSVSVTSQPAAVGAIYATVRLVSLPIARADVKAYYAAAEPVSQGDFAANTEALKREVIFSSVPNSECARGLSIELAAAAVEASKNKKCVGSDPDACLDVFDAAFRKAYEAQVKSCGSYEPARKALDRVDLRFRTLVNDWTPKTLTAEVALSNRPNAHFSFGALTGLAFGGQSKEPRADVDGGILVEAPLSRELTLGVLNYNPFGYDADAPPSGLAERFNFFGGTVLTPDFGLAGGVNIVLIRGLGVHGGWATIFHKTLEDGEQFGAGPSDKTDPFTLGRTGRWFAGLSYSFGQ